MKKWSLCILSMWVVDVALAEPPVQPRVDAARVVALVTKRVVKPIARAEARRSPFSRAEPPPDARRVRVIDTEAIADTAGKHFVRFAVDELRDVDDGADWLLDVLVGCAYVEGQRVFLQQGKDYVPASSLRGGDAEPRHDVCRSATGGDAS